jgi:hypothetical protein
MRAHLEQKSSAGMQPYGYDNENLQPLSNPHRCLLQQSFLAAKLQSFYSNDYYKWTHLLNKLVQDPRTTELELIAGKQLLVEMRARKT